MFQSKTKPLFRTVVKPSHECGAIPGTKALLCPHFWFIGRGLQTPTPSLSPKGRLTQSLTRAARGCRDKAGAVGKQGPGPSACLPAPPGTHCTTYPELPCRNSGLTGCRLVTPGWAQDSWTPACYLTTNLSEHNYTLQSSPQILSAKNFSPKLLGSSGFLSISHMFSLLCTAINLSLLQTWIFWFVWPHCASAYKFCLVTSALY